MTQRTQSDQTVFRVAVTIPDNTGTGSTIRDLAVAAGYTGSFLGFKINKKIPGVAGTDRAAFVVANPRLGQSIAASDFTSHGQYVPAGEDYQEPSDGDCGSYVRSASASTVAAEVIIYP